MSYDSGGYSSGGGGMSSVNLSQESKIIVGVVVGGVSLLLIVAFIFWRRIQAGVRLRFNSRSGHEIIGSDGVTYFNDGNQEYYDEKRTMHMVVGSNGVQYFAIYNPVSYKPPVYESSDGEVLKGKAYPADTIFDAGNDITFTI